MAPLSGLEPLASPYVENGVLFPTELSEWSLAQLFLTASEAGLGLAGLSTPA